MARRRRYQKRSNQLFKLFIVISVIVAILISALTIPINGGFKPGPFIISFLVTLVVCAAIAIILSIPKVKGKIGEKRVSRKLKKLSKKYGGYIVNDVTIPDEESGKTSQIDHIYISRYGIFVVETKNYAGRIYGNDSQREWTQVLAYGNTKNKLYNPVKQNQTHIIRLKKILNTSLNLVSVVVFVNANIEYIESDSVYSLSGLKYLIGKESPTLINENDVERIYALIKNYKENPVVTNKEHIKEIKQMKKDISNNICPRCGGALVLRKGPKGSFYGCSNYPKCKFTKKA